MDGIMHVDEFEVAMDLDQGRSGAPDFPLDEDTLAKRMDSTPWSLDYFRHQRNGSFWRAPIRRLEDITIPCFAIGGYQDGYRNSIVRMLEQVPAPVHAWVGPWNHAFPNTSIYAPRVEWRDQAVRWFDHWLKGVDNGVERDPRLIFYLQHSHPPGSEAQEVPGEWRADSWPPHGLRRETWYLAPNHQLTASPAPAATDRLAYVPSAGAELGFWWGELLGDQRPADAYSLVYDSAPLAADVAMFGRAHVHLRAARGSGRGRPGHGDHGSRPQRCATPFTRCTRAARARHRIRARSGPLSDLMGVGARTSNSGRGLERPVADALAHSLSHDDLTAAGRE